MEDVVILPKFQGTAVHWVGILQQKPEYTQSSWPIYWVESVDKKESGRKYFYSFEPVI